MQSKDITIETTEVPGTKNALIISFKGELTSLCINKISDLFDKIDFDSKFFIIAEMSGVSLISSAALGEFMGGRKRLVEKGGDLVFSALHIEMRTKLTLMGANKIFRFYNDTRSAINAFKWEYEKNPEHLHLSFPPFLKLVPPIRSLVSRTARQKGYGNRDSFRIETIVDEVCNNAIEHGLKGHNQAIEMKVKIDPSKIEISVTNVSDPNKIPALKALLKPEGGNEPHWKSDEKRGRGLTLIKMLSNELSVDCNESGTSVHVKKLREE
jgi:anti-anti-sigma factor